MTSQPLPKPNSNPNSKPNARRRDRRHAVNLVFQIPFLDITPDEMLEAYFLHEIFMHEDLEMPSHPSEKHYVRDTFFGVCNNLDEIDKIISAVTRAWEFNRLILTDLAILRVAIYEIIYNESIPNRVAANEAVEISRLYSGGDSPRFVNGLLGEVIKKYENLHNNTDK